MIRKISLVAAGFLGLALAAQPALAAPAAGQQAAVNHADLDLTTSAGRKELDRRVERAARKVCKLPAPTGSLIDRVDADCFIAALDSAKLRVAMVTQRLALRD